MSYWTEEEFSIPFFSVTSFSPVMTIIFTERNSGWSHLSWNFFSIIDRYLLLLFLIFHFTGLDRCVDLDVRSKSLMIRSQNKIRERWKNSESTYTRETRRSRCCTSWNIFTLSMGTHPTLFLIFNCSVDIIFSLTSYWIWKSQSLMRITLGGSSTTESLTIKISLYYGLPIYKN